jgi:hypothetical protein
MELRGWSPGRKISGENFKENQVQSHFLLRKPKENLSRTETSLRVTHPLPITPKKRREEKLEKRQKKRFAREKWPNIFHSTIFSFSYAHTNETRWNKRLRK